ncbi:MAG: glycosyltransferase, partial [Rhodobacteraceae bacterium]|nr:glycosyltransferase [Paracoccaceae bacterium]
MSDLPPPLGPLDPADLCQPAGGQQRISVVMANYNGAAYLRQAIRSVLAQTHSALELIISDDGSADASRDIIREMMADDPRIKLVEAPAAASRVDLAPTASGPAAARNRALAAATGDWVAIVDSDDLIHPERLARLLHAARALEADIVADDLIYFGEDQGTLLQALALQGPHRIAAVEMITGDICGKSDVSLGYLKPLIRGEALAQLRYDESLRIDEDHNLYLRLLLAGASFTVIPEPMYLYRRHRMSTSHRQSAANLERMIAAQTAFLRGLAPQDHALRPALGRRIRAHTRDLHYVRTLEAIKARDWLGAVRRLVQSPVNVLSLLRSIREHAMRMRHQHPVVRGRMTLTLQDARAPAPDLPPGHRLL